MKKIFILILILFCFSIKDKIFSQDQNFGQKNIPELILPSPDMAALGKYGDIPMNLYTGVANIEVPLYTLNFEGLQIPINLSYNSEGIRVSQEASWVGLGWSLSCEPVITRQINGHCDITKDIVNVQPITGYVYTDVSLPDYGGSLPDTLFEKLKLYHASNVQISGWDTEPDIFTMNLFGESVSFVLTQKKFNNGKIGVKMINPEKRYLIEYNEEDKSFIVINEHGFRFYFTEKEESVAATLSSDGSYKIPKQYKSSIVSGWKLSKIIATNNRVLNFNYQQIGIEGQPQTYTSIKRVLSVLASLSDDQKYSYSKLLNCYYSNFLTSITSDLFTVTFKTSDRLDLVKLMSRDGNTVDVVNSLPYNQNFPVKMDEITIKNSNGDNLFTYSFDYSYFDQGKANDTFSREYLRLKLDKVKKSNIFYREFSYLNSNSLPAKTFLQSDFWGFINSLIYDPTAKRYPKGQMNFPSYNSGGISISGIDRKPNALYSQNGLLDKVVYPTGGYTKLSYEANDIKVDEANFSKFRPYNHLSYKNYSIESTSVDYPESSEIFEVKENTELETILNISFGVNSDYELTSLETDRIKYTVENRDKSNVAYQIINVDNNQVVLEGCFTDSGTKNGNVLQPSSTTDWNKHRRVINLSKGKYKILAKALKHISNFYDADDGANTWDADYGKYYNYRVKVDAMIPLLSFSKSFNLPVGGMRVKSILNYNSSNILLTKKQYKYCLEEDSSNISSGKLIDELCFADSKPYKFVSYTGLYDSRTLYQTDILEVFSNNIFRTPSASHMGYSRVEAQMIDNTTDGTRNSGRKVSEFMNEENHYEANLYNNTGNITITNMATGVVMDNVINVSGGVATIPTRSYQDINGKLKKEIYYDNNDNIRKETYYSYDYENILAPNIAHPKTISKGLAQYQKWIYCNYDNRSYLVPYRSTIYALQVYKIISENISLISKTDIDYFNGKSTIKNVTYKYNENYQPLVSIESTSVSGIEKETHYKYPADFKTVTTYKEMIEKHIISPIVQMQEKKNDAEFIQHTNFFNNQSITNGLFLPQSVQRSFSGVDALRTDVVYNQYDQYGNLIQYTTIDGISTVILWGYIGQYPIAQIKNATYEQVKTALGYSSDDQINALSATQVPNVNAIRELLKNNLLEDAQITTFTYKLLVGMLTATDSRGVTTYCEYDNFNRLKRTYIIEDGQEKTIQRYDYHYKNE